VLTGYHPFYDENQYEVTDRIVRRPIDLSQCTDKKALDLFEKLMERDPKQRLTCSQIKAHPFFSKIDWEKLLVKKLKPPFQVTLKGELDISNFDSQEISMLNEQKEQLEINDAQEHYANFTYVNKDAII